MDSVTAHRLSKLTSEFYASVGASFSQTRQAPWPGWERVLMASGLEGYSTLRVCDLACGNLRFERFLGLREELQDVRVHAFDSCDDMVGEDLPAHVKVLYTHLDVAESLFMGDELFEVLGRDEYDLAVCFGFMHHLALPEHRAAVLDALVSSVVSGGLVAASFWQLSKSVKLLAKAQQVTRDYAPRLGLSGLGDSDYLLGWQGSTDALRYCHDFSEEEIDGLARAVGSRAHEVARFSADGASGNLNRYLVLRAR